MKINKILLPLLFTSFLIGSCQNNNQENTTVEEKKDVYIINDFESIEQLSLMKFPSPDHNNRGRMELSSEHVTHGNKSLKYYNEYGSVIEMCHYFDHMVDNNIDIKDMKSVEIDIYNASPFDSRGSLYLYANDNLSTVLNFEFDLAKNAANHVSFELSKVSLEFNFENIRAVSLKLFTPQTNYNKNIFYTFYLDNLYIKMGSEYTDVDKQYVPIIEDIKNKINNLPSANDAMLSDENKILEIANLISGLPDLYRSAIPNMEKYTEFVDAFNDLYVSSKTIDYDRNTYLDFDKVNGISQLKARLTSKLDIIYSNEDWEGKEKGKGSTKVIFYGDEVPSVIPNSAIELSRFDFVHFTIYNDSNNLVRIWFNYTNNVFIDIEPHKANTFSFMTSVFVGQEWWDITQLSSSRSSLVPSEGAIYFAEAYATGRSQATLLRQAKHAFNTLPDPETLTTDDKCFEGLTSTAVARELYELIEDKSQFAQSDLDKLASLEQIYNEKDYGIAHSAYYGATQKFGYGQEFNAANAVMDDRFGFVTTAELTKDILNDTGSRYEQGFYFAGDFTISSRFKSYAFYIYSPSEDAINLSVRTSNWDNWDAEGYYANYVLEKGWTLIRVPRRIINDSPNNQFAMIVGVSASQGSLVGEWKFTSLFGTPNEI